MRLNSAIHSMLLWIVICLPLCIVACATLEGSIDNTRPKLAAQDSKLVWPQPPQKPRIKYLQSISGPLDLGIKKSWLRNAIDNIFGTEEREIRMIRPYGIVANAERIFVTDPGSSQVHIFNMHLRKYTQIEKSSSDTLISPIGITTDMHSRIYITDSILKKILVFDKEGAFLKDIGSEALFTRPVGIAIYEDRIYVVDTHAHKILVLNRNDGQLVSWFGKKGVGKSEFNYPTNIFIDKSGLLYITDSLNFRIQIFDKDGNFISSFGKHGDGTGDFSKPKGIAVDSDGHIYVADAHFDNIQIFDRQGRLLLSFGHTGRKSGEMILPAGIFIDSQDKIYVADSYNNRIQIFQYLKEINNHKAP